LTPGTTPFKAVHVTELRTALKKVYDTLGLTKPGDPDCVIIKTDCTIVPRQTAIKKAHIDEIRNAVRGVE